jgi:uncharacterized protein YdeI (YjbR/CyaY-like superfamily)
MPRKVVYFRSRAELRAWFAKNHASATELNIGYYKKGTGKPTVSYKESVDEALCFGWIDGVRHGIDDERYENRFTPRKAKSNWSAINIARVAELEKLGLMTEAGRAAFAARDPARTNQYSFENRPAALPPSYAKRLRANRRAWAFWERQPPSYRRVAAFWVTSAKKEETRLGRLRVLIEDSENGLRIGPMRR